MGEFAAENADLIFLSVSFLTFAVCLWRSVLFLRQPSWDRALLIGMLGSSCIGYLFLTPGIRQRFDDAVSQPNLSTLLSHIGFVGLAALGTAWLTAITHSTHDFVRDFRRWAVLFTTALAAMVTMFALAQIETEAPGSSTFVSDNASSPYIAGFMAAYLAAFGTGMAGITHRCWRWYRLTDRPWLRRGLPILCGGALASLTHVVLMAAYVTIRIAGGESCGLTTAAMGFFTLGNLLFLVGFTVPALERLTAWRARWRDYQTIHPLWSALTQAVPSVVLPGFEGPTRPKLTIWRLRSLLYRRIVECRDAAFVLRRYYDPDITRQVIDACHRRHIHGDFVSMAVEAAQLQVALAAKSQDHNFEGSGLSVLVPTTSRRSDERLYWTIVAAECAHPTVTAVVVAN